MHNTHRRLARLLGCCFICLSLIFGTHFAAIAQSGNQPNAIEPWDLGDAPDSTNHAGVFMTTYSTAVVAKFPTVFDPGTGLPNGPLHENNQAYFLGNAVTNEIEADQLPDADGVNNLKPSSNSANQDQADDAFYAGVPTFSQFQQNHCQQMTLPYRVTVVTPPTSGKAYVNLWIDWDHSGAWGAGQPCNNGTLANEWIVQNQAISVATPGVFNLTTTPFTAWAPASVPPEAMWLRITVSDTPATNDDGQGPSNRWRYGETEDFYIQGVTDPQHNGDLGDAPDSTNHPAIGMLAYPSTPARFPTVFDASTGTPEGPYHANTKPFFLGAVVSNEQEADIGTDSDGPNNIQPSSNIANQDNFDDGLIAPTTYAGFSHCTPTQLTYTVMNTTGTPIKIFFNSWADWDRNGAWGAGVPCNNGVFASEWIVQNQPLTLMPGPNTFTSPTFFPFQPSAPSPFWLRLTVSESPATNDDGRGPVGGWQFGETEDLIIATPPPPSELSDLGDAPDSSNHFGLSMTAYPAVPARFPTVFDPGTGTPEGPLHLNPKAYHLGQNVSNETEADNLFDSDGPNNIQPSSNTPDQDNFDDGLVSPTTYAGFPHCVATQITYTVNNTTGSPQNAFFNAWADWNGNGAWGGSQQCANQLSNEWAVQNQPLTLAIGMNTFTSPVFYPFHTSPAKPFWLRMTVSDTPATNDDGRGPSSKWRFGETEDRLFDAPPPPPHKSDLGDAPDSTNSFGMGMTTYYPAVPARFPTVYSTGGPPPGPLHQDISMFNFGPTGTSITSEQEADSIGDSDGVFNIVPNTNIADQDRSDDGLLLPTTFAGFPHCQATQMRYQVYNNGPMRDVYFNMWADWNGNGAWGGSQPCPNNQVSNEWAVQNQVITINPGLNIFTSPVFYPSHAKTSAFWFRMTVSESPATNDDGRGITGGWKYGETEDRLFSPDLGDAPDSFTAGSSFSPMLAYSWPWWAWAQYPTAYNRLFALPQGQLHQNLTVPYVLGKQISAEGEAHTGPDNDGINNLVPSILTGSNLDRVDDAFPSGAPFASSLKHCQATTLNYNVTVPQALPSTTTAYVNVWIDYNRNGAWGGAKKCIDAAGNVKIANEWAVQNQPITLSSIGTGLFTTPSFYPYNTISFPWLMRPMWLRISISETPATNTDGRGPVGGWKYGETEDYLLKSKIIWADVSGTVLDHLGNPLASTQVSLLGDTLDPTTGLYPVIGTTQTNAAGNYTFTDVGEGSYHVLATHSGFKPQWFDHSAELGSAQTIAVSSSPINNVDFDLEPVAPPTVTVATSGTLSYNSDGLFDVVLTRQHLMPVKLDIPNDCLTCANNAVPSNVKITLRDHNNPSVILQTYTPTYNSSTNSWSYTIPIADLNAIFQSGVNTIRVQLEWDCGTEHMTKVLGIIKIIDPSGIVRNKVTRQPIAGATVTLFHVPEWTAKVDANDDDFNTCQSNASRNGNPWNQLAPTEQGMLADPNRVLMSPMGSSQVTGVDGHYGWNVEAGCWYVTVSAPGYTSVTSPVVGVPTDVTDLDIDLVAVGNQVYLPLVQK